ncbi:MAG: cell division protein ZapA [Alphaproteobacteria bacterium]|nr:cell division protein ZapA [Alphaproteobacteria bacterium]
MAEITLKINHRGYGMCCDEGQEERLTELAVYVDSRLRDIAASGAATNESHLLVLTSLVLADEVYDMRSEIGSLKERVQKLQQDRNDSVSGTETEEEAMVVEAIDYLAHKIERISNRLQISEQSDQNEVAA